MGSQESGCSVWERNLATQWWECHPNVSVTVLTWYSYLASYNLSETMVMYNSDMAVRVACFTSCCLNCFTSFCRIALSTQLCQASCGIHYIWYRYLEISKHRAFNLDSVAVVKTYAAATNSHQCYHCRRAWPCQDRPPCIQWSWIAEEIECGYSRPSVSHFDVANVYTVDAVQKRCGKDPLHICFSKLDPAFIDK